LESGSGPGGRPQQSPLDSTSKIAKVLNSVELRGFQRHIFTSLSVGPDYRRLKLLNLKEF
jgi:hypothetical protein